jgi:hypothetical protein
VLVAPVAYVAAAADRAASLVAAIGAIGVVLVLLAVVFGVAELLPVGIAFVGAEYGAYLALGDDTVKLGLPLIAAALLASAELGYASLEPPLVPAPATIRLKRALRSLGLVAGGATVTAMVLFVSVADLGDTAGLRLLGLAAAIGAVGLLAYLARTAA